MLTSSQDDLSIPCNQYCIENGELHVIRLGNILMYNVKLNDYMCKLHIFFGCLQIDSTAYSTVIATDYIETITLIGNYRIPDRDIQVV